MSKNYQRMGVKEAIEYIQQDEASARRLYKRYLDTAKKRAKTFEEKGATSAYGYRLLKSTIEDAKRVGFSSLTLSDLSYTLASGHTLWQRQREITQKTIDTLNAHYGKFDKDGNMISAFVDEESYYDFIDMMETIRELVPFYYKAGKHQNDDATDYFEMLNDQELNWKDEKKNLIRAINRAVDANKPFDLAKYKKNKLKYLNSKKGGSKK